jgi:hypothetical protein
LASQQRNKSLVKYQVDPGAPGLRSRCAGIEDAWQLNFGDASRHNAALLCGVGRPEHNMAVPYQKLAAPRLRVAVVPFVFGTRRAVFAPFFIRLLTVY